MPFSPAARPRLLQVETGLVLFPLTTKFGLSIGQTHKGRERKYQCFWWMAGRHIVGLRGKRFLVCARFYCTEKECCLQKKQRNRAFQSLLRSGQLLLCCLALPNVRTTWCVSPLFIVGVNSKPSTRPACPYVLINSQGLWQCYHLFVN